MRDTLCPTPAISFIIPAYNAAETLRATLASVLAQSRQDWEAIVVDDGSKDDTARMAQSVGDPRVRLVRHENRGLAGARNTGLRHARGEFVAFLDADDTVQPEFASEMLRAIGTCDAAACWYELVGSEGDVLGWTSGMADSDVSWDRLIRSNALAVTVIVRTTSLENKLGRVDAFDESLRVLEDWDLWLRFAKAGARWAPVVEMPLVHVRLRRGSLSQQIERMHQTGLGVIAAHAKSDAERQASTRLWNLQHAARYLACGDGPAAARLLSMSPPRESDDWAMLASMYLSSIQRTTAVGPNDVEVLRAAWSDRISQDLPALLAVPLRRAFDATPSAWRVAGREFVRSLGAGDLPVIFGMGRNGREALAGACEVADRVRWIDDRADASVPGELSSKCERVTREDLTRRHVVLITPSQGGAISRDLRARGVRLHERMGVRRAA